MVDALQKHSLKKTGIEKALAVLLNKDIIIKKEYGKAKIFLINQGNFEAVDLEGMKDLDGEIKEVEGKVELLRGEIEVVEGEVRGLRGELRLEEARERVRELEKEVGVVEGKLEKVRGGKVVSKEDMDGIKTKFGKMKGE